MILAIDVDYRENSTANVAGILFKKGEDEKPYKTITKKVENIASYESGQFYKRELPCILALLKEIKEENLDYIIVDGYVFLNENKKGLGAYLYDAIEQKIPIIGVAKNAYSNILEETHIYRGESKKALFITSVGINLEEAKKRIKDMHGEYRNPTLLKEVDQACRK